MLTGEVINQYVNPIGIENEGWKFYIVSHLKEYPGAQSLRTSNFPVQFYCLWLCVEFTVVYFLWVETKVSHID